MASTTEEAVGGGLQERLRSLIVQLRTEEKILDRVVHKGKNQHRRCHYFKSVLKVRRDVKLLLSAGVEEVLANLFPIIDGKKPAKKFRMLEGMKRKHSNGKYNSHERLLGIARLLSQMTEPILTAATQISSLLALSFFMGYCLLILALLARIRVLVQQMLLDTVSVFNLVSDLSQEKHSLMLIQDGIEAYRDYHPPRREILRLQCAWEGDKFVLHEKTDESRKNNEDEDLTEVAPFETTRILYDTLEISSEGQEPGTTQIQEFHVKETVSPDDSRQIDTSLASMDQDIGHSDVVKTGCFAGEVQQIKKEDSLFYSVGKIPLISTINTTQSAEQTNCQSTSSRKVAFIPVKKAASSETEKTRPQKKAKLHTPSKGNLSETNETDDLFFRLLTTGSSKEKEKLF